MLLVNRKLYLEFVAVEPIEYTNVAWLKKLHVSIQVFFLFLPPAPLLPYFHIQFVCLLDGLMAFNTTSNNISVRWWRLVLLVEESGLPGENYRLVGSQ